MEDSREFRGFVSMIALIVSVTLTIASNFVGSPMDDRMIMIALILAYTSITLRR